MWSGVEPHEVISVASLRIIGDDGSERVVELRDRKLQIGRGRNGQRLRGRGGCHEEGQQGCEKGFHSHDPCRVFRPGCRRLIYDYTRFKSI